MGFLEPDPFYQPEKFGLTTIGTVDWTDDAYQFHFTVVWYDEQGNLYWGTDSGCSCPSPFETFNKLEDLDTGNLVDLLKFLNEEKENGLRSERLNSQIETDVLQIQLTIFELRREGKIK